MKIEVSEAKRSQLDWMVAAPESASTRHLGQPAYSS